jgi:hypothetical protein
MAIILPSGFQITNNEPGDSRVVVADQTARLAFSAANVFKGLVVFQQDTQELYVLTVEGSPSNTSSWSKIFTATGTSGSYTGSFSGDGSGLTGIVASGGSSLEFALSSGTGIEDFIYDASEPITVAVSGAAQLTNDTIVKWNDTDGKFVTSSLSDNGTIISGTTSIQLSGANSILSGSFSGSFSGSGAGLVNIPASAVTGLSTFQITTGSVSASVDIGNTSFLLKSGSNNFISVSNTGVVTIENDLIVNGTTVTINTENLLIEDKFALFASGSITGTDGGIVIQSDVNGTGFALGYNNSTTRWVLEAGLSGTATSFSSPNAYIGAIEVATDSPSTAPVYGGSDYGHGTIHVNTSTEDIWIYA